MSRGSTIGRPRKLSEAQVATIMRWHAEWLAVKTQQTKVQALRQLARSLGVSAATIYNAIQRKGQYKQPSPEFRAEAIRARHAKLRKPTKTSG
jgi:transposase